ncbi:MAG: MXAN_5187 C-terminal domain-containing protein [Acidobacteriota bacterium]
MSWERELAVLNEAIRRLNAEYDAFLYGSVVRPPITSRRHVEEMFRRLSASGSDSAADQYRLSALEGRFSTLCDRWERLQAEKEAGLRPGIRAGFVSQLSPAAAAEGAPAGRAPAPSPNAPRPGSVESGRGAGSDADRDLFERYVAARRKAGEDLGGYRLEDFLARLEEEREKLRKRLGGDDVEFDVAEREGRVRLVARPKGSRK